MRILIAAFLFGSLGASAATESAPENVTFSRYLTLRTCYKGASCTGPTAMNMQRANVQMQLQPKAGSKVLHAFDKNTYNDDGIPFETSIHVLKNPKSKTTPYTMQVAIRSGQRESKVFTLHLKSLKDLEQKVLVDVPLAFEGGTVQAQVVLGPRLPLDRD